MVCAQDGGGLTSVVNAEVTIHILQTILSPAEFERPKYTFSVYEDVPEDSPVGIVKAKESLSKYFLSCIEIDCWSISCVFYAVQSYIKYFLFSMQEEWRPQICDLSLFFNIISILQFFFLLRKVKLSK